MGYHGFFFHINNCKPSEMKPRINSNMMNFPWRKARPVLDQLLDPQSLERSKLTIVKILLFLNSVLTRPINSILPFAAITLQGAVFYMSVSGHTVTTLNGTESCVI